MTAYTVLNLFRKAEAKAKDSTSWKLEIDGPIYLPHRHALQALSRVEDVSEIIRELVGEGMLDMRGSGERGNPRELTLTVTGRSFLENFDKGLLFVFQVSPDQWRSFAESVIGRQKDLANELSKILTGYGTMSEIATASRPNS
jgi:hypothetical protein